MSQKFNRPDFNWRGSQDPIDRNYGREKPYTAVNTITADRAKIEKQKLDNRNATPVRLPPHLFIPEGAESLDIRRAADIGAGTVTPTLLMSFRSPKNATTHFISYAVYSDGALAANQQFIPRVQGRRVFPYQGDPNNNFRIDLGLAPDLSNNSLISCQLTINPDELFEWYVINTNLVDIAMGVRAVGYIDYLMKRVNSRTGG